MHGESRQNSGMLTPFQFLENAFYRDSTNDLIYLLVVLVELVEIAFIFIIILNIIYDILSSKTQILVI